MKKKLTVLFVCLLLISSVFLTACSSSKKPLVNQCLEAYNTLTNSSNGHVSVKWTTEFKELVNDYDDISYDSWYCGEDRIYTYGAYKHESLTLKKDGIHHRNKDGVWSEGESLIEFDLPWSLCDSKSLELTYESHEKADGKTRITCTSNYDFVSALTPNTTDQAQKTWLTFTFDENSQLTELLIRGQYPNEYGTAQDGEEGSSIYWNVSITFHTFDETAVKAEFDRVYAEATQN